MPGISVQAQGLFTSRCDSPLSCWSYQTYQHSIIGEKLSRWQTPARVDPMSIPEAKYLQLCTLFVAQHATLTHGGRHFKNIFKTALTKIFLNIARFGRYCFFGNRWAFDGSITSYKHVYFWQKHGALRTPAMIAPREIHKKSQENLPWQIFTMHSTNKQEIMILLHSVTVFAQ